MVYGLEVYLFEDYPLSVVGCGEPELANHLIYTYLVGAGAYKESPEFI